MSTVAAGLIKILGSGKAFAGLVKKGAEVIRSAESNPWAETRLSETIAAANLEMNKINGAAIRGLISNALKCAPSDDQVQAVYDEIAQHPNAPFRVHRLLGEALKSSARNRRQFLAAVFFGLEFSALPDDLRDRVDLVVERLVPEDVALLMEIDEKNRRARPTDEKDGTPFDIGGSRVAAVMEGLTVRIGTSDDHQPGHGFPDAFFEDDRFLVSQAAFGALVAVGCIDAAQNNSSQGRWEIHRLLITELGRLVIGAIEEVRPGFAEDSSPRP